MGPKTRSAAISKAQYLREYRANLSPSVKKERSRKRVEKARLRRQALREKARQDNLNLKKARRAETNRRYRAKQDSLKKQQALSTPSTKAKHIAQLIDSASPSTSACLKSCHLKKSRERTAEYNIVQAASSTCKKVPTVRKALVKELASCNKSAVSECLKISRNHFYCFTER